METRASYVLIGAFTLAAMLLAVAFVLWMAKTSLDREFDEYDIVFREAVTGLPVSGAVHYNGIQVGEVRRLRIDPEDPARVIAHVRVAAGTPIRTDTRAKLVFTGLTGVASIQLSGGSAAAAELLPAQGREFAVIAADDSALQKLMVSGEDMVTSFNELLLRVSTLLNEENTAKVSATLSHLESLSGDIAASGPDIGATLADLAASARELRATLRRADRLIASVEAASGSARSLLDDEGRGALAEMRASFVAIHEVADSVRRVLASNEAALSGVGGQGLAQIGPLLAELRAALHRIDALAGRLEQDPARFLLGRDHPRERSLR